MKKIKIDVKSAIVDILKQEGIKHVFGHTGSHIIPMWEAVNNEKSINIILNKQEGNAIYMADGYARITKKPSIVVGTLGPGVTNMVTGLVSAYMDSIPIIVIGGTVSGEQSGRNSMQESSGRGRSPEQRLIFKACCKQALFAPSAQATPGVIREAFQVANSGRKGPVYIEIPVDYWDTIIDYERIKPSYYQNLHIPSCNTDDVKSIVTAIYSSKHPLIMIGEGAEDNNIKEIVQSFITQTGIPFTVSPIAKNYIDEYSSLYLGAARGRGKTQKVYEYMKQSDFILFLGARMHQPEMQWDNRSLVTGKFLAQVDFDEQEIGRVYLVQLSAVGSVISFINSTKWHLHNNAIFLRQEVERLWKLFPRKNKHYIVIATGYQGESVKEYFGNRFGNKIDREYVHSPKKLELRKRLLLADGLIRGTFLYLVGDVISNSKQMERVVASYVSGKEILGVISGAIDHSPAPTHALITTDNNHAVEIIFPPTLSWNDNQLREMGLAYYGGDFFYRLRRAPDNELRISPIINEALKDSQQIVVEKYFDRWFHFVEPKDLNVKIAYNLNKN